MRPRAKHGVRAKHGGQRKAWGAVQSMRARTKHAGQGKACRPGQSMGGRGRVKHGGQGQGMGASAWGPGQSMQVRVDLSGSTLMCLRSMLKPMALLASISYFSAASVGAVYMPSGQ